MRHLSLIFYIVIQFYMFTSEEVLDMFGEIEEVHAFVSKVEPRQYKGWDCECYNSTQEVHYELETECRCYGKEFKEVPIALDEMPYRITITDADIKLIERDSFQPYMYTLHEIFLVNLPHLEMLEPGTFRNIINLRTLYISHAPQIKFLHGLFEGTISDGFLSLRIDHTGLIEIPDFLPLPNGNILHMIDLDSNNIQKIKGNSLKVKVQQLTLNYNAIHVIEEYSFNGSEIAKLSLRGNSNLNHLGENAFTGLKSLQQLDLSETSIEELPVEGLGEIEILKIEKTPTMKVIPSVYEFANLREAYLTHSFHCCAFKYPKQHDPKRHAQHEETLRRGCQESIAAFDTGQNPNSKVNKKRSIDEDSFSSPIDLSNYNSGMPAYPKDWAPNVEHQKGHPKKDDHSHISPIHGEIIRHHKPQPISDAKTAGVFHDSSVDIMKNIQVMAFCGNLSIQRSLIKCIPDPNALNPCEDIMGSYYLRVSVWFVLILAVLGNIAVVVVVLFSGAEVTVSRFLMCNLAFADLCMGLYLLLIASMDLHSVGAYFNFAFDWQYGAGCQIAGFLTMFASQLSIFTLTVVTVERWFAIAYAIYLTRRIRLGLASKVMAVGWIYSILMAALPLLGVSNYSSTSICLPMEVNRAADIAYLIAIIVLNGTAFILIVFCYGQIYFSLAYETRHSASKGEMTIAKKMALLVFTDFVCWAPIAFFALTALAGYPLIGVTRSKILLVFFYPLNSCANPYLYAIMTAQYRKDFFILLSKFGLCTKKSRQYAINSSIPTNNSHPIPLISKINSRQNSLIKSSAVDDVFV